MCKGYSNSRTSVSKSRKWLWIVYVYENMKEHLYIDRKFEKQKTTFFSLVKHYTTDKELFLKNANFGRHSYLNKCNEH